MSLTLNMVGGGSGKLKNTDAILVVTVPTGSSVTATKGAVTLTPTIWTTSGDNTLDCAIFSIPASTFDSNAWTVTATLLANSASKTIVIDSAKEYELLLLYRLYLRNGADDCTDVTGGWDNQGRAYGAAYPNKANLTVSSLTTPYEGIQLSQSSGGRGGIYFTHNPIDLTDYNALKFSGKIVSASNNAATQIQILTSAQISGYFSSYTATFMQASNSTIDYTDSAIIDISSLTGSYYIGICVYSTDGKSISVYNLFLE